jgi:uncharacterized protein YbaR (Trm112 family)
MKPKILTLICDPITREALEIRTEPDSRGHLQEFLINPKTSRRFPIRDGIPIFLEGEVSGANKNYQKANSLAIAKVRFLHRLICSHLKCKR